MTDQGRGRPVRRTLVQTMRDRPVGPSTRVTRERQLRDEVKSGGNQPTDIRVIHRHNKPPASLIRHAGRRRS